MDKRTNLMAAMVLPLLCLASASAQTKPALRTYETGYYVVHTDLGRDAAREAELRLTRMAEEYRRRTRGFSGEIRRKLPFYLFGSEAGYHAAGGTPGTAGEYDPNTQTLMAFAGADGPDLVTWHTVQHEGFHQFADQVIGRRLPIWANEGLAEYFAEALFTGDSFVPGIIPQWRLKRIRETFQAGKFPPLRENMVLSHKQWNQRISTMNYDQVWSLVHYFVHGDNGAHREKFTTFLKTVSTGQAEWESAFVEQFGPIEEVEANWRTHWTHLPDDPTAELYAEATLRTLTGFLARATARRQRFDSFEAFLTAAERRELKSTESDWLPPSLLKVAMARVAELQKAGGAFTLVTDAPRPPKIVYASRDGNEMVGQFSLKGSRVDQVIVERRVLASPGASVSP
ncbi:MAG TPA: DUF1570 domain-containing protein [Tepidisphaeraceae bacterium]|nr:DUF1570 domain-containing protein [Tepidisphaeraceae bacterium]